MDKYKNSTNSYFLFKGEDVFWCSISHLAALVVMASERHHIYIIITILVKTGSCSFAAVVRRELNQTTRCQTMFYCCNSSSSIFNRIPNLQVYLCSARWGIMIDSIICKYVYLCFFTENIVQTVTSFPWTNKTATCA